MEISDLYSIFKKNATICTDTRVVLPHSIFFALKGENFNANEFAQQALNLGSEFAVVDEEEYAIDDRFLLVSNVLETLQQLANFHRKQFNCPVLAITGTNGKTTTKELVKAVLSEKLKVHYTKGNFNNHLGVPLTLLSMPLDTEFAVIEMGANHPGEIEFLCKIAEPNYGIITNIGKAHIEGFGSFEGVYQTKTELYRYLKQNKGKVFYSSDNELLRNANKTSEAFSYGKNSADVLGAEISAAPYLAIKWTTPSPEGIPTRWAGKEKHIQSQLIGRYNFENILAATAIGFYFGVEKEKIKNAIENYKPENNRSQFVKTERNSLILDAYNANPSSMNAAIDNFSQMEAENKMLILGDMRELGSIAEEEHQKILDKIVELGFTDVLLVGENFSKVLSNSKNEFLCFENADNCIQYLEKELIKNKAILIKASRGIRLEKLIPYL